MTVELAELLKKYRTDTATAAEKKLVEEKIKEFNLLQEYVLEQEELTDFPHVALPAVDAKKIKRQVNRKLFKFTFAAVVCLGILVLLLQFAAAPLANRLFYDPREKADDSPISAYTLTAGLNTELTNPLLRLTHVAMENTGIGKYTIVKSYDAVMNSQAIANPTTTVQLKRGLLQLPENERQTSSYWKTSLPALMTADAADKYQGYKEKIVEKLAAMPKSSEVDGALTFAKPLTLSETLAFFETKALPVASSYRVQWLAVEVGDHVTLGFDWFAMIQLLGALSGSNNAYLLNLNKTYPNLLPTVENPQTIEDQAQALADHFTSVLRYVLDNQKLLSLQDSGYSAKSLKQALAYVEKNGVKIKGVYLSGTVTKFTELAAKDVIVYADVLGTSLFSQSYTDEE